MWCQVCYHVHQVCDKGVWLASYKDVRKFRRNGILPSMFPSGKSYLDLTDNNQKCENGEKVKSEDGAQPDDPVSSTDNVEEEVSDLPLECCMRIMPHDQNTGAFFIAVLHKVSNLPGKSKLSLLFMVMDGLQWHIIYMPFLRCFIRTWIQVCY